MFYGRQILSDNPKILLKSVWSSTLVGYKLDPISQSLSKMEKLFILVKTFKTWSPDWNIWMELKLARKFEKCFLGSNSKNHSALRRTPQLSTFINIIKSKACYYLAWLFIFGSQASNVTIKVTLLNVSAA